MTKTYTIGDIMRLGLLKNADGKPYKDKTAISRIVRMLPYKTRQTKWGEAKCLTKAQIEAFNKKRA